MPTRNEISSATSAPAAATDHETGSARTVTRDLATAVWNSRWEDIPAHVRHAAKRSLLNYFAAAFGGCRDEAVGILEPFFRDHSAAAHHVIIGRSAQLDSLNAAFINAVSANVLDFDDTHHPTIIHPTAPIVPPLLVVAEHQTVSGAQFLHALVLGVEVACRLGNAVSPGHYNRGWHITSTCGVFGAAAAVGKLFELDVQRLIWAFGSAAAQSSGVVETLGTMAKSIGVGNAARNGLLSALLARAGIVGPDSPLEGRQGFFRVLAESVDMPRVAQGWGRSWEILHNIHKPYPCGIVLNPVIDACFELRRDPAFSVEHVASIVVHGNPLLRKRADRPSVTTGREAQVSAQHTVAVALQCGSAGVVEYSDAAVQRGDILALRDKVRIVEDGAIPVESATVVVTLTTGKELSFTVRHARGTLQRPLSDGELEQKLRTLAAYGAPTVDPNPIIDAVWGLEERDDASALMRLTRPAA